MFSNSIFFDFSLLFHNYVINVLRSTTMSKQNTASSRTKYLNLVKQLTGIDYEIVEKSDAQNEEINEQHILNHLANSDLVLLKDRNNPISQRISKREQILAARQQYNLEQIFSLALGHIDEDQLIERLDLDWIMKFVELAKQSYTPTMHELWSKILTLELVKQGSFSHKSLKTLSELSTKEAKIFYQAVKVLCRFGDEHAGRILTGVYKKPTLLNIFSNSGKLNVNLSQFGLSYTNLIALAELGLIYQQEIESAAYHLDDKIKLSCQGHTYDIFVAQKEVIFTYYKLTQAGYELSNLVKPTGDNTFIKQVLNEFSHLITSQMEITEKV